MRLFGFGKKKVSAEIVGNNVMATMIDPNECWKNVCALRSYETSDSIATCEMGFARAALTKSILVEGRSPAIAERIINAADTYIIEAFMNENTYDTQEFYGHPMLAVAPMRVSFYSQHVLFFEALAGQLGAALKVPGPVAIEASFIFGEVSKRVRYLLAGIKVV